MSERPIPAVSDRPLHEEEHGAAVRRMFDGIAPTYDVLNRTLSVGLDVRWRRRAIRALEGAPPGAALDLCAGTMDLTALLEGSPSVERVVAADFSEEMLRRGRPKAPRAEVVVADAMALPFEAGEFSAVICGFGIRNVADPLRVAREVRRVLGKGGVFVTLDSFQPSRGLPRLFHQAYTRLLFPMIGGVVSGHREAYAYFADSVGSFLTRPAYEALLGDAGFGRTRAEDLAFGAASIVRAEVST